MKDFFFKVNEKVWKKLRLGWSWQNEDKNIFCNFFKCSLNFRAHALQSELNKDGYTNFVKFRLQSKSYKIERAFEKMTKYVFVFILPTPT